MEAHVGCYPSVAAAALGLARHLGPEGIAAHKSLRAAADADAAAHAAAASMSIEAAAAAAEAEGLELLREEGAPFGYYGLSDSGNSINPYRAKVSSTLRVKVNVGRYPSVAAAALAVARHLGTKGIALYKKRLAAPTATAAAAAPMTMPEAQAAAEAEGLELLRDAKNEFGYYGVVASKSKKNPYQVLLPRASPYAEAAGVGAYGGLHPSVAAAALGVARHLGRKGIALYRQRNP